MSLAVSKNQPGQVDQPKEYELVEAFQEFNQTTERLSASYRQLEGQLAQITHHLNRPAPSAPAVKHPDGQQNKELADQFSVLLELLPAGVVLVDGKGRVDRFNSVAQNLFATLSWGRRWHEVRDESLDQLQIQGDEWLMGDQRVLTVARCDLLSGGSILLFMDVTEERRMQVELQHRRRLSLMGEMTARLAHQVRTPLATALLYAGQIGREQLTDQRRQHVNAKLVSCLRHIESMVGDMLTFSRSQQMQKQPLDLRTILQRAVATLEPRFREQKAELVTEINLSDEAIVMGHEDGLLASLMNLMENALQQVSTDLRLRLSLDKTHEGFLIRVADNGPGVPADIRDRIFEPFFTTGSRGTGLGLAVAANFIEEHEGRLSYCEQQTQGACFQIWLPEAEVLDSSGLKGGAV